MNAQFRINDKQLETNRLILRAFKETDLDDFYAYASVDGVGERAGWPHHKTKDETLAILRMFIDDDKTFAIVDKKSNRVIGSLGIERYEMEEQLSEFSNYQGREIGFVLGKDYWGKGLMPEALKVVIGYLFNELGFDFLLCGYYDFNTQSKRVQEKCGFKPYRHMLMDTRLNSKEQGTLNILLNPSKNISLSFSHPESLIYED